MSTASAYMTVSGIDVDVVYKGDVPERNFEGEIQRNLKLSEVLRILELNKVKFKLEGRTVFISN